VADLKAVRDAGYTDANVMEIVALVAMYSLTNFLRGSLEVSCDASVTPKLRCTQERFLGTRLGFS
jgi:hypothetical protein